MKDYKKQFIQFLLDNNSLKFGEFTLKSGRISPYFLNTGMLHSGEAISKLGDFYAEAIHDNIKTNYTAVFGPAYKGIPLAITTVNSLYNKFNVNCHYSFNRKEAKDHGDKGLLVGKSLSSDDKIVIVDDVITAGTAIREVLEILKDEGNPEIEAVVISVDRMEKGKGEASAIQEISESSGISFYPIVTIIEIIQFLKDEISSGNKNYDKGLINKMEEYRNLYGVG